jgi:hypothetical protein
MLRCLSSMRWCWVRIFNAVDSSARERAMIEEMTKARERERSLAPMVVFFSSVEPG